MEDRAIGSDDEPPTNEQARRLKASSLLWFISSRPYVPMADIRRRFGLATETGTLLHDDEGAVHIGLPRQAAETLLDLKRKQKVELQYDLEYATRIAVGTYPIRIRLAPPASNASSGRVHQQAAPSESFAAPPEAGESALVAEASPAVASRPVRPLPGGHRRRRR
jgi:hypothetical protein